jgi:hypothetical protein
MNKKRKNNNENERVCGEQQKNVITQILRNKIKKKIKQNKKKKKRRRCGKSRGRRRGKIYIYIRYSQNTTGTVLPSSQGTPLEMETAMATQNTYPLPPPPPHPTPTHHKHILIQTRNPICFEKKSYRAAIITRYAHGNWRG